jgi:ribosome-binding factor A
MSRRTDRINEQLREEVSTILTRQIKDPRLNTVISITRVESTNDLRSARVYISVMGNKQTQQEALEGIRSAASFVRREIRNRINMKHTPFLSYELDPSIDEADKLFRLMNKVRPSDENPETISPETSTPETSSQETTDSGTYTPETSTSESSRASGGD